MNSPSHDNDVEANSGTLQEMVDEPDPEEYPEEDPLILDSSILRLKQTLPPQSNFLR